MRVSGEGCQIVHNSCTGYEATTRKLVTRIDTWVWLHVIHFNTSVYNPSSSNIYGCTMPVMQLHCWLWCNYPARSKPIPADPLTNSWVHTYVHLYQLLIIELQPRFSTIRCFGYCFASPSIDFSTFLLTPMTPECDIICHSYTHFCLDANSLLC